MDWSDLLAVRARGGDNDAIARIIGVSTAPGIVSFAGGFPDPGLFPDGVLGGLLEEILATDAAAALQYAPTRGLASTRDFVAGRLDRDEGRRPDDDQLLITSGGIEALELLAKTFLDPGDVVVVEAPTYLGAILACRGFEARIVGVPLDDDGLVVDELAGLLRDGLRPKLVYTIPDHHNPAGVSLAADRRPALVDLARRHGFLLIEDVAYRDLGFDGMRATSLWSLGPDVVVQIGTFSKTFCPGVRLGWAAGPGQVVRRMTTAKQNTDQCAGALGQRLVEAYGRSGLLDAQIARAQQRYGERCRLLLDALAACLPESASWTTPRGGFFTWLTLPDGADTIALAQAALDRKVAFVPGPLFFADGTGARQLRLSFSNVADNDIADGIRRLAGLVG